MAEIKNNYIPELPEKVKTVDEFMAVINGLSTNSYPAVMKAAIKRHLEECTRLDELKCYILENWGYNYLPKLKHIRDMANEIGIQTSQGQGYRMKSVCVHCGTHFPIDSYKCENIDCNRERSLPERCMWCATLFEDQYSCRDCTTKGKPTVGRLSECRLCHSKKTTAIYIQAACSNPKCQKGRDDSLVIIIPKN